MSNIVKVQISWFTSDGVTEMLAYNKDFSVYFNDKASNKVIKAVGKTKKAYFYYRISNKRIILGEKAPDQDW